MIKNKIFFTVFCYFTITGLSLCEEKKLIELIQLQYDSISSFSGDFVQISFKKDKNISSKKAAGKISYKRPGKMRWSYTIPDEQLLVTDGKTFWLFDPILENVTIQKIEKVADGTALSFLLGIGDLRNDFSVRGLNHTYLDTQDGLIVEIIPKKNNSNLSFIQLQVHPETYNLKKILLMDRQGNYRTIELNSINYNIALGDKLFEFEITEGMEIVEADY